jgi:2-succinyl-6-hydroxy-2,4-cyclohexadiene-1-carboxylate synthase
LADGSSHHQKLTQYWLSYRIQGCQTRPKLLFLHGFMGCRHDFDVLVGKLEKRFCCITVDLPGHGQTKVLEPENGYRIDEIATGLVELLQRLDLSPCHLMGYSMGGRLALYLACRFPAPFQSVLLESASPGLATEPARMQRQQRDEQLAIVLETGSWPSFLDQWYQQSLFAPLRQHPDFGKLLYQRAQNDPVQLAKVLRGLGTGTQPSLWEDLSHIEIPIRLVAGELDTKFVNINREMTHFCKNVQISVVANSGHTVHFEQPQALVEILETHIETLR